MNEYNELQESKKHLLDCRALIVRLRAENDRLRAEVAELKTSPSNVARRVLNLDADSAEEFYGGYADHDVAMAIPAELYHGLRLVAAEKGQSVEDFIRNGLSKELRPVGTPWQGVTL